MVLGTPSCEHRSSRSAYRAPPADPQRLFPVSEMGAPILIARSAPQIREIAKQFADQHRNRIRPQVVLSFPVGRKDHTGNLGFIGGGDRTKAFIKNGPKMSNIVKEIFDRIPHADGGFRRRLTSGILLLAILLVGIFGTGNSAGDNLSRFFGSLGLDWKYLGATGIIIAVFSIIFTVGYLIEIIGEVFVKRIFHLTFGRYFYRNALQIFEQVKKDTHERSSNERSSLELTDSEAQTYQNLPRYVQEGLTNPYGRRFEVAYRYLVSIAPDEEKNWLIKLDSNNQNLFSIICAIFLGPVILLLISPNLFAYFQPLLILFGALIAITGLSAIYSVLLRVTIANALDMLSLRGVAQIAPEEIEVVYEGEAQSEGRKAKS